MVKALTSSSNMQAHLMQACCRWKWRGGRVVLGGATSPGRELNVDLSVIVRGHLAVFGSVANPQSISRHANVMMQYDAPIQQNWGEQRLSNITPGENRSTARNRRLKILDQAAGLAHKSPHKYRHGYAIYGLQHCQTMAQYHALSRNLMHANIAITDERYVHLEEMKRGKLLS